jgi:DNA-binding CsgD family transcriptional regulator
MLLGTVPVGAAVPSLTRWGLSTDADLVFRTLTTFGPQDRRALARDLGLPGQRIADALAELRAAGAAAPVADGRPADRRQVTWAGRSVDETVTRLRADRLRLVDRAGQVARHHHLLAMLRDRLGEAGLPLGLPAVRGLVSEHVRYLPNRAVGQRRLNEYAARHTAERMTINTEQVIDPTFIAQGTALDRAALAAGTRIRVLSTPPADGDRMTDGLDRRAAATYRHRESLQVPMKLFLFDRRVALLRADPADPERGYLDITHPGVVGALVEIFERHWAAGADSAARAVPRIELSDRERELVTLLAQGHTDVSAAAELRITARSVTNVLRRLMDRLGVENRFQLGLALGALRVTHVPSLEPIVRERELAGS